MIDKTTKTKTTNKIEIIVIIVPVKEIKSHLTIKAEVAISGVDGAGHVAHVHLKIDSEFVPRLTESRCEFIFSWQSRIYGQAAYSTKVIQNLFT
uniref:Uncharacterized protein n=1 Tax=Romanomermis culicivorax TaxID=13658 RepID=A0A915J7N2_ROMCU